LAASADPPPAPPPITATLIKGKAKAYESLLELNPPRRSSSPTS